MFYLRQLLLVLFFVINASFSTQLFAAANISISPTQIDLMPSQKNGVFTVVNKGEAPVNLQINAKSWDMDENGTFIETDNSDFVFYPKTITIKPKEQGTLRVGYTGQFPDKEKPYRVIIEEIPEIVQPKPEQNKLKMGLVSLLRLSIPLYVVPGNDIPAPQVELGDIKTEKQKLRVGLKNPTAYHVTLKKIAIKLLKENTLLAEKSIEPRLQRILGEHVIFVDLPMDTKKLCQQADEMAVQIEMINLAEPYQTKVALKPGCQLK